MTSAKAVWLANRHRPGDLDIRVNRDLGHSSNSIGWGEKHFTELMYREDAKKIICFLDFVPNAPNFLNIKKSHKHSHVPSSHSLPPCIAIIDRLSALLQS